MDSIHDMIKKQVAEEVQRKEDAKEPCRECATKQELINCKDAEIARLKEERAGL